MVVLLGSAAGRGGGVYARVRMARARNCSVWVRGGMGVGGPETSHGTSGGFGPALVMA